MEQSQWPEWVDKRPSTGINMTLLFLNEGAGDGYRPEYRCACYAVEQGQAARPKAAAEAEGDLGDPNSAATGSSSPGACAVQPRHRQQAARVRSRGASRPRCGPGQSCRHPRDRYAEEDATAGAIRDHRANAGSGRVLG